MNRRVTHKEGHCVQRLGCRNPLTILEDLKQGQSGWSIEKGQESEEEETWGAEHGRGQSVELFSAQRETN